MSIYRRHYCQLQMLWVQEGLMIVNHHNLLDIVKLKVSKNDCDPKLIDWSLGKSIHYEVLHSTCEM